MKSTRRKKANKLSSGPPDARDHDTGHLDGRTVNTLRIEEDGDEPTVDHHGRVWPTPPDDALPLQIVLPRLDLVRKVDGTTYMARCSLHRDNTPSLSLRVTDNDDLLVHCFAGCVPTSRINRPPSPTGPSLWLYHACVGLGGSGCMSGCHMPTI